jgi:hypothetical protein
LTLPKTSIDKSQIQGSTENGNIFNIQNLIDDSKAKVIVEQ